MGPINNDNNDDLKEETRGRPTKGFSRMDVERKIRLDSEMDYLLQQKCRSTELFHVEQSASCRTCGRIYSSADWLKADECGLHPHNGKDRSNCP